MFGVILIAVGTLLHLYVCWRIAAVPLVLKWVPRSVFLLVALALWGVFVSARTLAHGRLGGGWPLLEWLGMNWLGVLFVLCQPLLLADLLTGFGWWMPRLAPILRGVAVSVGVALALLALVQGARAPVVTAHHVALVDLPQELEGTVLVAMSDLHLGAMLGKRWLEARIAQALAQRPDMVVLVGDIFDGHGIAPQDLAHVLSNLRAPLGAWAVLGNHDYFGGVHGNLAALEAAGFEVLRDRWVEIRPGLLLAGVDDLTSRYRRGHGGEFVKQALAGRPPGATVLLSHTPWQYAEAAQEGVGLMLSGHTHNGQIWPFGYLVQRVYPLLSGRHAVDSLTLIVGRGTGSWGPRMRLWHPGEILRVTLHRAR